MIFLIFITCLVFHSMNYSFISFRSHEANELLVWGFISLKELVAVNSQ